MVKVLQFSSIQKISLRSHLSLITVKNTSDFSTVKLPDNYKHIANKKNLKPDPQVCEVTCKSFPVQKSAFSG